VCVVWLDEAAWIGDDSLVVLQEYSCAVLSGGAVRCWGRNELGQVMLVAAAFSA
jgi:hypothetical protein